MTQRTPDFRKMTEDDLRNGISELNKVIKPLRALEKKRDKVFWGTWGASTLTVAGISVVFPPVALLAFSTGMLVTMDKTVRASEIWEMRDQAESLRAKFKAVYRARPGRKQFDIDARRTREAERKKQKKWFRFGGK